jgi:hypothetical protein
MSINAKDKDMERVEKKLKKTAVEEAMAMVESESEDDMKASDQRMR